MWWTTEKQMDTNSVNIRSLHTNLVFQFFRVTIRLRSSTASPPTALHNSEELWCDVFSDGITRVNECVPIFDDGEQVLMIGALIDNEFYRDQIRNQLGNRGISADQSAS